ncbi:hypothetical protein Pmani_017758 [Petrolisthes manimaculis]|uniref:Telomere-associated protein Rif1 N-terminal domain-containing protein n=1 Tax=Petrolisthes manimaculis TaxID=1843537 RepID=A0AAE1U927_9EUCA|nr:hypothetical protein Pmani_017758 [Petrolisthes manimaculis]
MKDTNIELLVEKCTSQKIAVRIVGYRTLALECTTEGKVVVWSDYASLDDTQKTLGNLKTDLLSSTSDHSYEAAGLCGCLLANDSFLSLVTSKDEIEILTVLIRLIKEVKEKRILTRILWSVARSKLKKDVYCKKSEGILEAILDVLQTQEISSIIAHEALQVINTLLTEAESEMMNKLSSWFITVFKFMFHNAVKVRTAALASVKRTVELLQSSLYSTYRQSVIQPIILDLKTNLAKDMHHLLNDESPDILQEWKVTVQFLGVDLHTGTSLINSLLEVIEKAFKSSKSEIRVEAFGCWQALIDNFSLDSNVLSSMKRLKLLLAPLKAHNTKTEDIAQAKLLTWWHLIYALSKTSSISLETVVAPLLKFCFSSVCTPGSSVAGLAEKNLMLSGVASSPGRRFCGLYVMCAEILAQTLAFSNNSSIMQEYKFSISVLEKPVISSPLIFVRHYAFFFNCMIESVKSLCALDDRQYLLGVLIFQSILMHVETVVSVDTYKKDSVEVIKLLFSTLLSLEKHSTPGDSQSNFVFKFLKMTIMGKHALPVSVLNSRQYHITSGTTIGDMMSGTLSNYIIHQLCRPSLLHHATLSDEYMLVWSKVLNNSKPPTGKLGLLHATIKKLDGCVPFLCPSHSDVLIKLWTVVVQQLLSHIEETHIIDQGDGTYFDWKCIYLVLLFPLKHSFDALSSIDSQLSHRVMKIWSELWIKFIELTPLSTTAEPNIEVEHIGRTLLDLCQDKLLVPPDVHATAFFHVADALAVMAEWMRYSELGKTPPKLFSSPAKPKKKPHPLHNLAACMELITVLFEKVLCMVSRQRQHIASKLCDAASHILQNILQARKVCIDDFLGLMVKPLSLVVEVNPAAKFNSEVENKIITMFSQFLDLLEKQYGKNHTSDQLVQLIPVFTTGIASSNEIIKEEFCRVWRKCFASTTVSLPATFYSILKSEGLPPASLVDLHDIHGSRPKENVKGNLSGSVFMREARAKLTPSKTNSPKAETPGKSPKTPGSRGSSNFRTDLEAMKDEDFVRVSSPASSGRRVLTEHQLERMQERRTDIPALYSDLSQTSQLPSQNISDGFSSSGSAEKSVSILMKPTKPEQYLPIKVTKAKEDKTMGSSDAEKEDSLSFAGKFSLVQKENVPKKSPSWEEVFQPDIIDTESKTGKTKSDVMPVCDKTTANTSTDSLDKKSDNCGEKDNVMIKDSECFKEAVKPKEKETTDKQVTSDAQADDEFVTDSNVKQTDASTKEKAESDDDICDEAVRNTSKNYMGKKKKQKLDVSPRRYSNRESDYTDEELDEELRKTSIELQRSLDDVREQPPYSEIRRRKAQTPVKKTISDLRRSLRGNIHTQKMSIKPGNDDTNTLSKPVHRPRICFREVAVSPSVIHDDKLVKQVPEVKLGDEAILKCNNMPKFVVSDTDDSEDEIPTSQSSEEILSNKSALLKDLPVPIKINSLPQKDIKHADFKEFSPKLTRSKRKRTMSQENENSDNVHDKKRRTCDIIQKISNQKQTSSDESVIILEVNGKHEKPKYQRKSKDNLKQKKDNEEISECNSDNLQGGDASSEGKPRQNAFHKVTRSGRKVVAPNKDMPEPMTPPGATSLRRKKSLENVTSSVNDDDNVSTPISFHNKELSAKRCLQKKITELFDKEMKDAGEEKTQKDDSFNENTLTEMGTNEASSSSIMEDDDVLIPEKSESSTETFAEAADEEMYDNEDVIHENSLDKIRLSEVANNEIEEIEQSSEPEGLVLDPPQVLYKDSEEAIVNDEMQVSVENSSKVKPISNECEQNAELTSEQCVEGRSMNSSIEIHNENRELSSNSLPCQKKESQVIESTPVEESKVLITGKSEPQKETIEKDKEPIKKQDKSETIEKDKEPIKNQDKSEEFLMTQKISEHTIKSPEKSIPEEESKIDSIIVSPIKTVNVIAAEVKKKFEDKCKSNQEECDNDPQEIEERIDTSITQQETMDVELVNTSPSGKQQDQQQEELSPDKQISKLKMTVSTPERLKKKGHFTYAGSRAAMLVACAKQNIKNRGESPTKAHNGEESRHREGGISPGRRSSQSKISPASTPSRRKRKHPDSDGGRPWAKHEPSPGASPTSSILKKTILNEDTTTQTPSSTPSKYRRVSFADPPVSDKVEIPPSPKIGKGIKAQKRLDMTNASSPLKETAFSSSSLESQEMFDSPALVDCSQPVYPSLTSCEDKIEQIVHHLTTSALVEGLVVVLEELGVFTVGQLCQLTEADINKLPVRSPKISATIQALTNYEDTMKRRETRSESIDDVEAQLNEMFGETGREDKENLRPNSQDSPMETRHDSTQERRKTTEPELEVVQATNETVDVEVEITDGVPLVPDEVEGISPLDSLPKDLDQSMRKQLKDNPHCLNKLDLDTKELLFTRLLEKFPNKTKESLFTIFLEKLPYKTVIDSFHRYLTKRNSEGEGND